MAPVEVIYRGKLKLLSPKQRIWLKRLQAIEPLIGRTKADHRTDRCWPKGSEGDAVHAVLRAAGFNIRWIVRAIAPLAWVASCWPFPRWRCKRPPWRESCAVHSLKPKSRRNRDRCRFGSHMGRVGGPGMAFAGRITCSGATKSGVRHQNRPTHRQKLSCKALRRTLKIRAGTAQLLRDGIKRYVSSRARWSSADLVR